MILENINPYDQSEFESKFKETQLYQSVSKEFDVLTFDWSMPGWINGLTPRQFEGSRKTSATTFYYLDHVFNNVQGTVYDIGCGWNIFKKFYPNIIGLDLQGTHADKLVKITDEWIKFNESKLDGLISICSLHFIPLSDLRKRIIDISKMLKPGGYAFVTFNLARMIENDRRFDGVDWRHLADNLEKEIRTQFYDLPFVIDVFDMQLRGSKSLPVLDECIDGNIRMVFHT